jgi:Transcription factor Tfb4
MEQPRTEDDDSPSILTLIIDTNPIAWKLRRQFGTEKMIQYNDLVAQLIIFCHAYALMNRSNRIVVIANHPSESVVLYPSNKHSNQAKDISSDSNTRNFIPFCHLLHSVLSEGLLNSVNDAPDQTGASINTDSSKTTVSNGHVKKSSEGASSLAQALSLALCGTVTTD